jgi:hypothetical protein
VQPDDRYLSTIESTLVVLEGLNRWNIENISDENIKNFLTPFFKMIEYQKNLISDPKSNAVRFKKHSVKKNLS